MAGPKIGCQLNSAFGDRTHTDLHGVLNEVREAGFDGVELGRLCQGDIAAAARSLDEHGLVQWSLHTMYEDGGFERVDEEIEYLNALGGEVRRGLRGGSGRPASVRRGGGGAQPGRGAMPHRRTDILLP